jgi:hypothetical protein
MFIDLNFETIEHFLNQLKKDTNPLWGTMTASEVIVHLEDTLLLTIGPKQLEVLTPEDKLPLYVKFLESDKEMPRGFKVDYLIRNEESNTINLNQLIDSHLEVLERFLNIEDKQNFHSIHPIYGNLNYEHWIMLHTKHYTHHFKQFGLIEE